MTLLPLITSIFQPALAAMLLNEVEVRKFICAGMISVRKPNCVFRKKFMMSALKSMQSVTPTFRVSDFKVQVFNISIEKVVLMKTWKTKRKGNVSTNA